MKLSDEALEGARKRVKENKHPLIRDDIEIIESLIEALDVKDKGLDAALNRELDLSKALNTECQKSFELEKELQKYRDVVAGLIDSAYPLIHDKPEDAHLEPVVTVNERRLLRLKTLNQLEGESE